MVLSLSYCSSQQGCGCRLLLVPAAAAPLLLRVVPQNKSNSHEAEHHEGAAQQALQAGQGARQTAGRLLRAPEVA
jgi:hypothetical protein